MSEALGRKAVKKVYTLYLRRKWGMSPLGGVLLASRFLGEYKARPASIRQLRAAHRRGFPWEVWNELGLEEKDWRQYLSTARYYAMQPLNGRYTSWVDDKLMLRYLCLGTELDKYMPAYYYLIDDAGRVCRLPDGPGTGYAGVGAVAALLREKGQLALKKVSGSAGAGFYKAEYADGAFFLNGERMTQEGLTRALAGLRDYIVTEYLRPHPALAEQWPDTPNPIRYFVGRVGEQWLMLRSFIRFGTRASGSVEHHWAGGVLCYVDENGRYESGNLLDKETGRNRTVDTHPDTDRPLRGEIPHWDQIAEAAEAYCKLFPQMKYLGFDFAVTDDDRVKLLEVNSLTSLAAIQMDGPIFNTANARAFFEQYI